jgi:hypothetical protein
VNDMPDHGLRAHTIVRLMTGQDTFWVVETPAEIREKLRALKEDFSMGLGEEAEDEGSMLRLIGLDIWTGEAAETEPYELAVHPGTVVVVRGISETYWKRHLASANAQGGGVGVGGVNAEEFMQQFLGGKGVGGLVIGPEGIRQFGAGPAKPLKVAEGTDSSDLECCCGHPAFNHDQTAEFVGECAEAGCTCGRFHTHDQLGPNGEEQAP